MRICDLREKEVINIRTGKMLGCVLDIDFDHECGRMGAFIIPGPPKYWGMFGRDMEYVLPWECIKTIGPDIILVDVDEEECFVKCE